MIKAVFFDIDGTLVSFQTHEVPPSTVEALAALRERGVKVFIATGRHKDSIDNLGTLEFDGYVTLNGGYCWADGQAIYKHPIPRADIDSLIRFEQEVKRFPCALVEEDGLFQNYIDDTARQLYGLLNFPLPPLRGDPLEPAVRRCGAPGEQQSDRYRQDHRSLWHSLGGDHGFWRRR